MTGDRRLAPRLHLLPQVKELHMTPLVLSSLLTLAAVVSSGSPAAAQASDYPNRTATLVVSKEKFELRLEDQRESQLLSNRTSGKLTAW